MNRWDDPKTQKELASILSGLFKQPGMAQVVLSSANVPTEALPGMQGMAPQEFWTAVVQASHAGINPGGLDALLDAALEIYVHNERLKALRIRITVTSAPGAPGVKHGGPIELAFIAANPAETERLALGKDYAAIRERIGRSRNAGNIKTTPILAATPQSVIDELLGMKPPPAVVHFSGHGTESGELILEGADGTSERFLSKAGLRSLLAAMRGNGDPIPLVVLNACYTAAAAKSLDGEARAVVGWVPSVEDGAAIAFAGGFYASIANGGSVHAAVEAGRALMGMEGFGDAIDDFHLHCAAGQDPKQLILVP